MQQARAAGEGAWGFLEDLQMRDPNCRGAQPHIAARPGLYGCTCLHLPGAQQSAGEPRGAQPGLDLSALHSPQCSAKGGTSPPRPMSNKQPHHPISPAPTPRVNCVPGIISEARDGGGGGEEEVAAAWVHPRPGDPCSPDTTVCSYEGGGEDWR